MVHRHIIRVIGFLVGVIVLSGVLFIAGANNHTEAGVGLSIQPIKISHTIQPGKSISGKIVITNASDDKVAVEMSVEDFIPMPGTITIQYVGRAEGVTTVRDWITLNTPEPFILEENESREVIYTIDAPADAEPGGHFGIAFFRAKKLVQEGQLKIGTRVGSLIFVTIPGSHLQKGKVLDFEVAKKFIQKGPIDFTITFENTGTVHFEPKGVIKIINIFGKVTAEIPVSGWVVLPTGIRDIGIKWEEPGFLLGPYRAELSIIDPTVTEAGESNVLATASDSFYVFPVWYVVGFVAMFIGVFFGLKYLRRKVKISVSLK